MASVHDPLATGLNGESTQSTGGIKGKITDATGHLKTTAADFGRSAQQNIDKNLQSAAGALENASSAIRSKLPADRSGKVASVGYTAADKIEATARYLRLHDSSDMMRGAESWARQNPGAALGGALALGFFIGLTMQRDKRY
ncbi:MAG TPA: hypothetical protein VES20_07990 [Bryobacteraceae bacterium]|nr:hypothetical protein [Bryobacteraceae bacterium]